MRIAIVSEVFLPKIDGITNRLRHTVECLRESGHEVRVIAPQGAVAEHAGARVVRVPALPFPPYPGLRLSLPDPRIVWELARFGPQVVHAVGPACLGLWAIASARALRIPVVASYHTDLPGYASLYGFRWAQGLAWSALRRVHNVATLSLCPSRFTQRQLQERGFENVGIWRGGVDAHLFHPWRRSLRMRARLTDGCPDRPVLLYAGRIAEEKNLGLFAGLLDALPDVHLALVGDGPARATLTRRFARHHVTFTGFLRERDLATAFASADVFVMPSTTETMGSAVLEAMSAGCPVVAADAGALPNLVRHGENGLLFDPATPAAAAATVAELLANRGQWHFYAQQGRKTAENATWARETARLVESYRKAVYIGAPRGIVTRLQRAFFPGVVGQE
jgi:glycosyltransferase involved in cell wall biosynthesis